MRGLVRFPMTLPGWPLACCRHSRHCTTKCTSSGRAHPVAPFAAWLRSLSDRRLDLPADRYSHSLPPAASTEFRSPGKISPWLPEELWYVLEAPPSTGLPRGYRLDNER